MPILSELHEMHLRQLDAIISESELLLQREGGLDGELKTSGYICEKFVRTTLEKFVVPFQFRITTGYIASSSLLRNGRNLPQCDIIIVDSTVPPILRFPNSDIEVVAREAVVGIIEVKRTLTPTSLFESNDSGGKGALAQINNIINTLGESQSIKVDADLNKFNRHIGRHNFSSSQPMLAVIGLQNKGLCFKTRVPELIAQADCPVDFVWALDGSGVVPACQNGSQLHFYSHTARPASGAWQKISTDQFKSATSPFYRTWELSPPIWAYLTHEAGCSRAKVFASIVGIATLMLSRTFGTSLQEEQINEYFFR